MSGRSGRPRHWLSLCVYVFSSWAAIWMRGLGIKIQETRTFCLQILQKKCWWLIVLLVGSLKGTVPCERTPFFRLFRLRICIFLVDIPPTFDKFAKNLNNRLVEKHNFLHLLLFLSSSNFFHIIPLRLLSFCGGQSLF